MADIYRARLERAFETLKSQSIAAIEIKIGELP